MQTYRITNLGRSPRGIHNAKGSIVTIQPGETREVALDDGQAQRYAAKVAGGDTLDMVSPLGKEAPRKPAPPVQTGTEPPSAPATPTADGPKKRGRKSNAQKAAEAAASGEEPAADPLAALRAEAVELGIPEADAAKWGERRLTREIEARKQG